MGVALGTAGPAQVMDMARAEAMVRAEEGMEMVGRAEEVRVTEAAVTVRVAAALVAAEVAMVVAATEMVVVAMATAVAAAATGVAATAMAVAAMAAAAMAMAAGVRATAEVASPGGRGGEAASHATKKTRRHATGC